MLEIYSCAQNQRLQPFALFKISYVFGQLALKICIVFIIRQIQFYSAKSKQVETVKDFISDAMVDCHFSGKDFCSIETQVLIFAF